MVKNLKNMARLLLYIKLLLFAVVLKTFGQNNLTSGFYFLNVNFFGDKNSKLYKMPNWSNALFSIEPGVSLSYEFFYDVDFSSKLETQFFIDALGDWATNLAFKFRFRFYSFRDNYWVVGLGPAVYARHNWQLNSDYTDDGYKLYKSVQYKIWPLSAEVEYNYIISRKTDLFISLMQPKPISFTMALGLRYWFNHKSSKCYTCPSYK